MAITPEQLAKVRKESIAETRRILRERYPDLDEYKEERKRRLETWMAENDRRPLSG